MHTDAPHQDRPLLGISLMLAFCMLAPFADALIKLLGQRFEVGQLVTLRFIFQAAILVPLCLFTGRSMRVRGRDLTLLFLRTLLHIAGIALVALSLMYLPIADAIAISYVMPFIMLLLGKYVLHEEVGLRRLAACVVGFGGTLLVVQPAFVDVGWPALLPLGVAFVFAGYMMLTRQIATTTDPIGAQAVAGGIAIVIMAPVMVFLDLPGLEWRAANGSSLWLIIAMGIAGTLAHVLLTWSLKYAPASTLAPMQYLEIPFATLIGWLIFSDLPGALATVGILITLGAGLYIVFRERASHRSP
ncbi:MAG: DMT family transporter [Pelagimonas sp.]|jgi:drug/metabolite transporter (DMT)-like permease|nr:DMT family transporter [Pelagimonas sp.]